MLLGTGKQLIHKYWTSTALPYISNANVIEKEPHFVAGSNVMTSIYGYVSRRPGFATDVSQTFTGDISRIFVWQKWNAGKIKMICTTSATTGKSDVWRLRVGTDTTYGQIFTSQTSSAAFDFVTANNQVYFGNGTDMRKWPGDSTTTTTLWGIAKPAAAPTAAAIGGGNMNASNGGYRWKIAYENTATGHIGQVSAPSTITGNFVSRNYTITGSTTTDGQVNSVRVYRTADGGATWFELPNSPTTYSATWSLTDTSTDSQLTTNQASLNGQNAPPTASSGATYFASRIWTFAGDTLYMSNFEEQLNGVEEESFASINFFNFGTPITCLTVVQRALLVFTPSAIYRIRGDSLTSFLREPFLNRMGATSIQNVANGGQRSVAWLDTSGTVFVTDGVGVEEIGLPIRSDLSGIDQTKSSIAFHSGGVQSFLMVQDSAQDKMWVYDTDNGIWMVPWTIGGTAIHSGETATGTYTLLMGRSRQPLKWDTTIFQDLTVSYTASLTLNLVEMGEGKGPGEVANLEYVAIERNAVALSDVAFMQDDDPATASYTTIFANEINAPNRTVGTNLVEKWYRATTTATTGRRISTKLTWPADSNNFKLYAMDTVTNEDESA